MAQTIANQLNVKEFPFNIKDKNGTIIYHENTSGGFWFKRQYDANGNEIYYENSDGYWAKHQYDANGNEIYYENSTGTFYDNRPKVELSMDEIATKFGVDVNQLKIKK